MLQIRDWVFCDAAATSGQPGYCKKGSDMQTGKWLDLEIEVKGKKDTKAPKLAKKKKGNKHVPNEYSLGDGAVFSASTQVNNNGEWEPMADGFPLESVRLPLPRSSPRHAAALASPSVLATPCRARVRRRPSCSSRPPF